MLLATLVWCRTSHTTHRHFSSSARQLLLQLRSNCWQQRPNRTKLGRQLRQVAWVWVQKGQDGGLWAALQLSCHTSRICCEQTRNHHHCGTAAFVCDAPIPTPTQNVGEMSPSSCWFGLLAPRPLPGYLFYVHAKVCVSARQRCWLAFVDFSKLAQARTLAWSCGAGRIAEAMKAGFNCPQHLPVSYNCSTIVATPTLIGSGPP